MTNVTGNTTKAPSGPYWYWTKLGPNNVDLTNKGATLPPGHYTLYWDFRGQPGSHLTFSIDGPSGPIVTEDDVVPSNGHGWGVKPFVI